MARPKKSANFTEKQPKKSEKPIDLDIDSTNPFAPPSAPLIDDTEKEYTKTELLAMSAKELIVLCQRYTDNEVSTLERKSKIELADIILSKGEKKPQARAPRVTSDTNALITAFTDFMEGIKQSREKDEKARLYKPIKDVFSNNANNVAGEYVDNALLHGASKFLVVAFGAAIIIDATIGFKNIPALFSRLKNKATKKEPPKEAAKEADNGKNSKE